MKKIKFLSVLLVLFTAISFTSCDNEPIDGALNLDDIDNGGGDGGGGGGASTGDYWPTALNNQWIFSQNGIEQDPMKITSINSIGGSTYYTFDQMFGTSTSGTGIVAVSRLKKSSGNYYIKIEDITIDLGFITGEITGFEMVLLKDYLEVGQTWNGSYNQTTSYSDPTFPTITQTTNYTGTMLERDATLTFGSTTYTNVLKVRVHQETTFPGVPATIADTDYWFSKDVGPIKVITTEEGGQTYTSNLMSYILN